MDKVKIITLIDNVTYKQGLVAEHGLSLLIKTTNTQILFDTGQTSQFLNNAIALGEDLQKVEHVVISHGHYDHVGGLEPFLKLNNHARVWIHASAFEPKYSMSTGELRPIGMPHTLEHFKSRFHFVDYPVQIVPSVWLLPHIKQITSYETPQVKLKTGPTNSPTTDAFTDEITMYIHHGQSVSILSGCAHRGIINTIVAVKNHSGQSNFEAIIGGTHLNGAPAHRIEATINALQLLNIKKLLPNHCTGIVPFAKLQNALPYEVIYAQTGHIVTIGTDI